MTIPKLTTGTLLLKTADVEVTINLNVMNHLLRWLILTPLCLLPLLPRQLTRSRAQKPTAFFQPKPGKGNIKNSAQKQTSRAPINTRATAAKTASNNASGSSDLSVGMNIFNTSKTPVVGLQATNPTSNSSQLDFRTVQVHTQPVSDPKKQQTSQSVSTKPL